MTSANTDNKTSRSSFVDSDAARCNTTAGILLHQISTLVLAKRLTSIESQFRHAKLNSNTYHTRLHLLWLWILPLHEIGDPFTKSRKQIVGSVIFDGCILPCFMTVAA